MILFLAIKVQQRRIYVQFYLKSTKPLQQLDPEVIQQNNDAMLPIRKIFEPNKLQVLKRIKFLNRSSTSRCRNGRQIEKQGLRKIHKLRFNSPVRLKSAHIFKRFRMLFSGRVGKAFLTSSILIRLGTS
ncbi:hypothetical protein BpHYR1_021135 [Brachionus plicatilis]|uniref:Uncharacterized protein n=1 Tax=Brachionus plicatilis TaxID=10195 RepID=A0A3M7P8D3_BRAPC|nr:hypothetical protein BpHYR1_021135 [Brachionus plicatilis]